MAKMIQFMSETGEKQYPATSSEAVGMSDGSGNLDSKLAQYATIEDVQSKPGKIVEGGEIFNHESNTINSGGVNNHAEGQGTKCNGSCNHSEGRNTQTFGVGSHSEGDGTVAGGNASHSEGMGTVTAVVAGHVEGKYNAATDSIHIVGGGTSEENRKNLHEIKSDGSQYMIGVGGYDGTNRDDSKSVQESLTELVEKITNKISFDDLDLDEKRINELLFSMSNTRFIVTYNDIYNVGVLEVLSDSSAHVLTQVFTTQFNSLDDGVISDNSHRDDAFFQYTRFYAFSNGSHDQELKTWSKWKLVYSSEDIRNIKEGQVGRKTDPENDYSGEMFNDYVNNKATGDYSHAEGYKTKVSGKYSHAEGSNTTVEGNSSHAEGNSTTASGSSSHAEGSNTTASGGSSHSEGYMTTAEGSSSHAEGDRVIASGSVSHAEGSSTTASGQFSHAEGHSTKALGNYSHAEGKGTIAQENAHAEGLNTNAGQYGHTEGNETECGDTAHAEGYRTHATGIFSHAEGNDTWAKESSAHAEGYNNKADAKNSHAEGSGTHVLRSAECGHSEGVSTIVHAIGGHAEGSACSAVGMYSHAEGEGNVAQEQGSHVEGRFSNQTDSIHIVGIGTSNDDRKNAHEISKDGKHFILGIGGYNGKNKSSATPANEIIAGLEYYSIGDLTKLNENPTPVNMLLALGSPNDIRKAIDKGMEIKVKGANNVQSMISSVVFIDEGNVIIKYAHPSQENWTVIAKCVVDSSGTGWDNESFSIKIDKGGSGSGVDIVQSTGDSQTAVMSQKAVTEALIKSVKDLGVISSESELDNLYDAGIYIYKYTSGSDVTNCNILLISSVEGVYYRQTIYSSGDIASNSIFDNVKSRISSSEKKYGSWVEERYSKVIQGTLNIEDTSLDIYTSMGVYQICCDNYIGELKVYNSLNIIVQELYIYPVSSSGPALNVDNQIKKRRFYGLDGRWTQFNDMQ